MVNKVDALFEKLWSLIGAALCNLSGKSNFFVARVVLLTATVILMPLFALQVTSAHDSITGLLAALLMIIWPIFQMALFLAIGQLEKQLENPSGILSADFLSAVRSRLSLLWSALFAGVAFGAGIGLGYFLAAGSLYLATQDRPKRPSVFKRLAEWAKTRLQHSAPIPVGAPA